MADPTITVAPDTSAIRPGRLVSVNVGLPRDVDWNGRTVRTGIWKTPVTGPVMVRTLNVDGDGQGDLGGHGGPNRAVLVYQVESYEHWRRELRRDDLTPGIFGENFTVEGLPDDHASETGNGSDKPCSRSPSPGSPATGWDCDSANPRCPRCWSPTAGPSSTCGCCRRPGAGRGPDRPGLRRPRADERRRGGRPALPARSRPGAGGPEPDGSRRSAPAGRRPSTPCSPPANNRPATRGSARPERRPPGRGSGRCRSSGGWPSPPTSSRCS